MKNTAVQTCPTLILRGRRKRQCVSSMSLPDTIKYHSQVLKSFLEDRVLIRIVLQLQPQYRLTEESGPAHLKTFIVNLKLGKL